MTSLLTTNTVLTFLQGFLLCAGLIIAIGPQNLFVLQQGLRRQHLFTTALCCTVPDIFLISLGLGGLGTIISANEALLSAVSAGGALFLFGYAISSFRSAWRGKTTSVGLVAEKGPSSVTKTIVATLAVSLLNPGAYIDTVLMIGTIGGQFPLDERMIFGAGAVIASTTWFFTLAYGSSWLAPLFRRPTAWRTLDAVSGCFMFGIAGLMTTVQGTLL